MIDELEQMKEYLAGYDGEEIHIMEICGSHTAAITRSGIRNMLSERIKLISGPGCPVCVTPTSYIDRLTELAQEERVCVVSFGDMFRVPGSSGSLSQIKGEGADIRMVYSPADILKLAVKEPEKRFVFAAVGFETTTPLYADLLEELTEQNISNVKLLTALKTMPAAVDRLCTGEVSIDAFLAPGHVCCVAGSRIFEPLAEKYSIPFGVAGFEAGELLPAIYGIVRNRGKGRVFNYYTRAVTEDGNKKAMALTDKYFIPCDAVWRGLGRIAGSGMRLREEYAAYDAGSMGLDEDKKMNDRCLCGEILVGKKQPENCPLFGRECTPTSPQGACMVSEEGSCRHAYPLRGGREKRRI